MSPAVSPLLGLRAVKRAAAPIAALSLVLLAAPAWARKPIAPLPTDPPTPSATVMAANKVTKGFFGRLEVRNPKIYKGMKVFPVVVRSDYNLGSLFTLDEALGTKNALHVAEMEGGAQVNTLRLENASNRPVFIMSGEIMRGAKQDRTLQADVLIPPKSGQMTVRAFCTEHGRWVAQSERFEKSDLAVPNSVRGVAKAAKEQSSVWSSIADNQAKLRVAAPTQAAKDVYTDKKVVADTKPYIEAFAGVQKSEPAVVGVVVTYGSKLLAVDVFGDDALFARMYPKLLRSYVVDVVNDPWRGDRSLNDVKGLLATARNTDWASGTTDGVGTALELSNPKLHATALVSPDEALIHADMFEEVKTASELPSHRREPANMIPNRAPNVQDYLQEQRPIQIQRPAEARPSTRPSGGDR